MAWFKFRLKFNLKYTALSLHELDDTVSVSCFIYIAQNHIHGEIGRSEQDR